jgi:inorganic pyrophosphatase
MKNNFKSFAIAKEYLGKKVHIVIDRPLGSKHPKHNFVYETNYGFVPNTKAPDGEELDAYLLGVKESVKEADGICIAVAHRNNDDDDKLIIVPEGIKISKDEIAKAISFQEKWFDTEIVGI